ncbi:hypothetical protein KZ483_27050 [Paenibacillus sp. sptzw28]|uniref:hypothetical protein n=1 Tax=Paenibacillus sp. sptzw28 TaxID=715179 RepID=UPI001C6F4E1A|nr:hypothetical protein [Paenibacillus sp. sptzw28]QYR21296.1 hypothetical protein KZ483_27050 [Paenibacillus sp. sptzw28]
MLNLFLWVGGICLEPVQYAERIIEEVRRVILNHTSSAFIGLIVQGSAVKGGFIQGCSDIDFILYLEDSILNEGKKLPLELCLDIHKDLSKINVEPFRYIQFSVLTPQTNSYLGPIKGTYRLIAGRLLVPEATSGQLLTDAVKALSELNPDNAFDPHRLFDHGEDRIERSARLLCTIVWPVLFQLLTVIHKDGIKIWNLSKQEAISLLGMCSAGTAIQSFHQALLDYYPQENSVDKALAVIQEGVFFLRAAKQHWTNCLSEDHKVREDFKTRGM